MNEETKLQNKCNKLLRDNGISYFKHAEKWLSGVPDVQLLTNPTIWIEYKTPTGKLSKIQEYTMGMLTKAGQKCFVVRTLDQMKEVLRDQHLYKDK